MKYLSLKTGKASKIGQRSKGDIHYRILTDQSLKQLYLFITSNDDGGYYSKEVVPFEKIEQCLKDSKPNIPLSSKLFKSAFIGRSSNNAAFLAAILRNEKLITPVVDAVRKHSIQPGWEGWKTEMLSNKGKPFEPELGKATVKPDPDDSELDDADLALLQIGDADEETPKPRSKKS